MPKADAFFREIDIGGTNSSNTQYSIFHFPNPGTLIGYTIRPGDKFYFWQYEWPGTEAGMRITFTDASSTNWIAVDQYGNYMNAGIAAGGTRIVDLSGFAGKQVSALDITSAVGTTAGAWASSFHDIALVSADGTVISIYNGEATNPTVFDQTNGATGQTTVVSNSPGRYDPNFSTMYYHDDQLGTSRMMTSHSGYPIWQGTFLPYGEEYNPQMTMNHFKFTGKERDSESQLDYFGARYYGSALGRFITPDWAAKAAAVPYAEFADPQSLNLYTYVRNIPTVRVDADGHCAEDACILEVGVPLALNALTEAIAGVSLGVALGSLTNPPTPTYTEGQQVVLPSGEVVTAQSPLSTTSQILPATVVNTQTPASTPTTGVNTQNPPSTSQSGTVNATTANNKSTTPVGTSSSGQKINAYGEKLGGSGRPMRHSKRHSTRKAAKDAARHEGKTAPEEHGGDGHFHPTDQDGEKIPNSTHHEYPK